MEIETENGLKYLLDNVNYTASIIKSPKVKGKIVVPIFIQHENHNFTITSIQKEAFARTEIDFLEFPQASQMISFGENIFEYSDIKKIQIPSSLRTIDQYCFNSAQYLTDIEVSPGNKNFSNINNQILVGKSNSYSNIFDSVYFGRVDLEELIVPPNVKFFLGFALRECKKLEKIVFTEDSTLENLDIYALSSYIKKIVLPKNIKSISNGFDGYNQLTDIEIPPENEYFKFIDKKYLITKDFYSKEFDTLLFVPHNMEKLIIPKYIKYIERSSISSEKLKILDFEEGSQIETIEQVSFHFLEKMTIPKTLISFTSYSFQSNASLKEVVISPENRMFKLADDNKLILTKGEKYKDFNEIFLCLRDAKKIIIPSYIKEIESFAFECCKELTSVSFTQALDLENIGKCSFRNCSKLESAVIPPKVKVFYEAFDSCENLKYIKILANEVSFSFGFNNCDKLELISFPNACKIDFNYPHLAKITKIEIREDAQLTGDVSSLKDKIVYIGKNYEFSNEQNKDDIEKSDKDDIEKSDKDDIEKSDKDDIEKSDKDDIEKSDKDDIEKNDKDDIEKSDKDDIEKNQKEIENKEQKSKQHEKEIKLQKKKIEELEKQLKQQETEIKEQNLKKEELEKRLKQQQTEINEQKSENNELKNQILQLKKQISTLQLSQPQISHFSNMIILDSEMVHNLRIIDDIGRGSAGKVVKVGKEEFYAMKIMNVDEGNNFENFKHFINEYELLNMLHHPNIIKVYGIFYGDETTAPSILMEYCPKNLDDIIKTKQITNYERAIFIYQIAEGFKYIHYKGIIHRDIKPRNILIGSDGLIKICDFGISKFVSNEDSSTMTIGIGTQKFMAPEIINEEKQYTEKVDVYSFGVLLFYILCGKTPEISIGKIANGIKAEIPNTVNEFSKKLINLCWSFDPQSRPSFNEICVMLKDANYELVELSRFEKQELIIFVNKHNQNIPNYEETRSSILPKIKSYKSTLPQMSLLRFSTQRTKIPKSIINNK